jgi:hypothetical protein
MLSLELMTDSWVLKLNVVYVSPGHPIAYQFYPGNPAAMPAAGDFGRVEYPLKLNTLLNYIPTPGIPPLMFHSQLIMRMSRPSRTKGIVRWKKVR